MKYSKFVSADIYAREKTDAAQKAIIEKAFADGWDAAKEEGGRILSPEEVEKHLLVVGLSCDQIQRLRNFYRAQTGKDIDE